MRCEVLVWRTSLKRLKRLVLIGSDMWNLIHLGLWRGQEHLSERNQWQLYFKFIWQKFHRHKRQLSNNCCTQATKASQDLKNGFKPPKKSWAFCKGINIWREKFTYLWKHPRKKLDQLSVALISFKKCERSQEQIWTGRITICEDFVLTFTSLESFFICS